MLKTLDQDDTEAVALDPERVRALLAEEELAYDRRVPGSRELFARARRHSSAGCRCGGCDPADAVPLYFDSASGARLIDVDGNGTSIPPRRQCSHGRHSPEAVAAAIAERSAKGMMATPPTEARSGSARSCLPVRARLLAITCW